MRRIFTAFLALVLPALSVSAGVLRNVSLDECFSSAMKQSETMADQGELVLQAEEQARQAWAGMMPAVTAYGSHFRQEQPSGASASSSEQNQARISGSLSLFRGFRDFAAIRQAGASIQYRVEARRWAGLQLYADVAQAYFAVLSLRGDLVHLDKQMDVYSRRIEDLRIRVRVGRSRQAEVFTTQTALALLKVQRTQVIGQLQAGREVLAFLTGLDAAAEPVEPEEIPAEIGSLDTWIKRVDARPDLAAARSRLEAARNGTLAERAGHWPSVDISGNYYLERPGQTPWPRWDAQMALTLPIFAWFATASKVSTAESQVREAALDLSRLTRSAVREIRILRQNLDADISQLEELREAVDLSEKNYQEVQSDFNLNLVDNLDVLQALVTYQDAVRSRDKMRYLAHLDHHRLLASSAQISDVLKY